MNRILSKYLDKKTRTSKYKYLELLFNPSLIKSVENSFEYYKDNQIIINLNDCDIILF
jgi:hypothetical protein